jgi:hypothetical protein
MVHYTSPDLTSTQQPRSGALSAEGEWVDMNATMDNETARTIRAGATDVARDSGAVDVMRIDRPQRGALRLVRSERRSLYVIRLQRP